MKHVTLGTVWWFTSTESNSPPRPLTRLLQNTLYRITGKSDFGSFHSNLTVTVPRTAFKLIWYGLWIWKCFCPSIIYSRSPACRNSTVTLIKIDNNIVKIQIFMLFTQILVPVGKWTPVDCVVIVANRTYGAIEILILILRITWLN